ncbi:MAG: DUF3285 domain-containing protein [Okeania sp. SIO2H7]|uniref:DUF3285 domain-containing protein n=1 Tax=Okeania sp. SIO2G5 TaxID=2607796 RepID=UPI0013C1C6EA|nr:DUF3285 domain-containing protein [Okeania sp. SIO2G5]NEP45767.1 DUF3285 domain-containing protein [Okeania sp. SIO2H7]NEP76522.1 DUF3285 domain-containing protein [Okeania sp. SIO2G5]
MTDSTPESTAPAPAISVENPSPEPPPSYVKLAMRNMVRKGGKSLFHFFLTTAGLIGLFIGLAYLTR